MLISFVMGGGGLIRRGAYWDSGAYKEKALKEEGLLERGRLLEEGCEIDHYDI